VTEVTATKKRRRRGKGGADKPQAESAEETRSAEPAEQAGEAPDEPVAADVAEEAEAETTGEPGETAVPLIELPEPAVVHTAPRPSPEETELLLDSVLDALPQPKEPGQGRGGRRRASTAVIAGGELAPRSE
jgi:ribonuclease E